MNRRGFFGSLGVTVCGLSIFPRKSESAQSEGFSHEEMAQIIVKHSNNAVSLIGDTHFPGITRYYHYADDRPSCPPLGFEGWHTPDHVGKWHHTGDAIGRNYLSSEPSEGRTRFNIGSRVVVHLMMLGRLRYEDWYEISNPLLKVIRCVGDPASQDRVFPRYFARFGERWMETS